MLRTKFNGYSRDGRRGYFLDMGGDAPPAPDYTPMANASKESAEIMAAQADRVLDESKRQYDRNLEVAQPVIEAQRELMDQSKQQGDDYFAYMKDKFRPVEESAAAEALKAGSEADQEAAAGRAIADVRRGATAATNMAIRQGLRYGLDPVKIGKAIGDNSIAEASAEASAANAGRTQEKQIGWAKKLDVAGMGRGLPGASQGAYSVATNAGNSAVGNSRGVGQDLVAGTTAAAGLVGQGQQLRLSGLGTILNSQTSAYNNGIAHADDGMGSLGAMLGGAAKMYGVFAGSSKKIKTRKKPISEDLALMGLKRLPVEQWDYKPGVEDGKTHIGPYAEDVHREFGDVAAPGGKAIDLITMNGITMAAVKSLAKKVDGLERVVAHQSGSGGKNRRAAGMSRREA